MAVGFCMYSRKLAQKITSYDLYPFFTSAAFTQHAVLLPSAPPLQTVTVAF